MYQIFYVIIKFYITKLVLLWFFKAFDVFKPKAKKEIVCLCAFWIVSDPYKYSINRVNQGL
jgi:hypothetical protein